MKKEFVFFVFFVFSFLSLSFAQTIKTGYWTGNLTLTKDQSLPFIFNVTKKDHAIIFKIKNSNEEIVLINNSHNLDSLILSFPNFNSQLHLHKKSKKELVGYWINFNKGLDYRIPCTVNYGYHYRFEKNKSFNTSNDVSLFHGKWEVTFEHENPNMYKAVGIFKQNSTLLSGTFLTETGDYRFLEGNVFGDSLFLSCFDGSHAFLFTGKLNENQQITGNFYSGKHYKGSWIGKLNADFSLTHPDSITKIKDSSYFSFKSFNLDSSLFSFPNSNYSNKVVVIQLMGTWCPNCMDETVFLQSMFDKYHSNGLEVIAIAYEMGENFENQCNQLNKFIERKQIRYKVTLGGTASKKLASEQFNMLNEITSFPTTLFIGKDGKIKKIHTGFYGPGTGEYYQEFIYEKEQFILKLLND